jgi:replicative DNA helicase
LGSVLLDDKAIFAASEVLVAEDFYLQAHRIIYQRMLELATDSKAIDIFTLRAELKRRDEEEKAGGPAYLAGLTDGLPRSLNVKHYAGIVKERATSRMLIGLCTGTINQCYEGGDGPARILEEHEGQLFKIAARGVTGGFESSTDTVTRVYRQIEDSANRKSEITGLPTGFIELDRMTAGLHPQNLIIVAGRPGLGKTSFVCSIAANAAVVYGKCVGIFSLEMSTDELGKRNLAALAEVDLHKIKTGFLNKEDWMKLGLAARRLSQARLFIDDCGSMTITQLRAKAQRLALEHGIDLVVVDYLQLLHGSQRRYDNRTAEVTEISSGLKNLAKELKIPVIAAAQLSRDIEKSARKPRLSDLRESGSIEQDADLVLFIHRPELITETEENAGVAEIVIGKQRNGMTGDFQLAFLKQFTKFTNLWQEQ